MPIFRRQALAAAFMHGFPHPFNSIKKILARLTGRSSGRGAGWGCSRLEIHPKAMVEVDLKASALRKRHNWRQAVRLEYYLLDSLPTQVVCCSKVGDLAEGVKPGVSLAAGASCEFALAFLLNVAILYSMSTLLLPARWQSCLSCC